MKRQGWGQNTGVGAGLFAVVVAILGMGILTIPGSPPLAAACQPGTSCPVDLNKLTAEGKAALGQATGAIAGAQAQVQSAITGAQSAITGQAQGLVNKAAGEISNTIAGAIPQIPGVPQLPAIPGLGNITSGLTSGLPSEILSPLGSLPGIPGLSTLGPPVAGCVVSPGVCQSNIATNLWWSKTTKPNFSSKMQSFLLNDFYTNLVVLDFWNTRFKPALQQMTTQLGALDIAQTGNLGMMMDGVVVNSAILGQQRLAADAYKNYTPSETLCRFGTMTRSLATADQRQDIASVALSDIAAARQLGTKGGAAGPGVLTDRTARIEQFTRTYCNPGDNDGKLGPICGNGSPASTPSRMNKDISIGRTILGQDTLDVDLTNSSLTADEEDVLALSSNLYGHDVLKRLTEIMMSDKAGNTSTKLDYLNLRQLVAFRNVAQASYNQSVARRAKGGPGAAYFMANILREMGMSDAEAARVLGGPTTEPSYHAQMNILTKKIYENPNFYTNLVDKPANVDRQTAAMQAFGLMQDRDIVGSYTRQELLMALMLEMKLRREQRDVERNLKSVGQVK